MSIKILRMQQVIERTGLKKSSIYNLKSEGRFPDSVSLGGKRAVGWIEEEINEWLNKQIQASRKASD